MSASLDLKRTFQYSQALYSVVRFSLKLFYNYNAVLRRKYQYKQVLLLLFLIYLPEYSSHLPSAQLPGPVFRPLLPMNFQRIRLLLQKEHYHLSNDSYFLHNRCSRVDLSSDFKNAVILSSF